MHEPTEQDSIPKRSHCSIDELIDMNTGMSSRMEVTPELERQYSIEFSQQEAYECIYELRELITYADKAGNTSLHHAAMIGLERTFKVLAEAGADPWKPNCSGLTAALINDLGGLQGPALELCSYDSDTRVRRAVALHKALMQRPLVPIELARALLTQSEEYESSCLELLTVSEHCEKGEAEHAVTLAQRFVNQGLHDSHVYLSIALYLAGYGSRAAQMELDTFVLKKLSEIQRGESVTVDPVYFYARYLIEVATTPMTKVNHSTSACHMKSIAGAFALTTVCLQISRLAAADSLAVARYFPTVAARWLHEEDDLDVRIHAKGWVVDDDASENSSDEVDDEDSSGPEALWGLAKRTQCAVSRSMDMLMQLTGLREVKHRALGVFKTILLERTRPPGLDTAISMNFLFVGNAGCGKTTVANLLAGLMSELGFRLNPTPLLTSAADILRLKDAPTEFAQQVDTATGGIVFIDDVHAFKPSSHHANDSNRILDYLLMVCESKANTTSFIVAGHTDDIQELITYNDGFRSRFSFVFDFVDYTEPQLRTIFNHMVVERGFRLQSRRECGVPIAKVLCQRIARGARRKGFGNARECRSGVELAIINQSKRLGSLLLLKGQLSESDYRVLTREDVLGGKPELGASSLLKELDSMVGLRQVKEAMKGLMDLQMHNSEREERGEHPELISLNKIFMGNPGTGGANAIYGIRRRLSAEV
jgi:hypothetical protein